MAGLVPLLQTPFLLCTSSPSFKTSPASACPPWSTSSQENQRYLCIFVRFPPSQPPQNVLNLLLLGSLWTPLSAGSMGHGHPEEGVLPGKTLPRGDHLGTCPALSEGGCLAGEEPFLQHSGALSVCLPRGKPAGPAGAHGKAQGLRLSEATCTSRDKPSVVSRPSGRAWFFGFPFKAKCRITHLVSFPLPFPVLLLTYRRTSWSSRLCREGWQREAAADAGSDEASAESCQRGPAPTVQRLSVAILPLVFSPLPFLFFCLNGFGLDKTFPSVHNASASAQIHERILSFHNCFYMI